MEEEQEEEKEEEERFVEENNLIADTMLESMLKATDTSIGGGRGSELDALAAGLFLSATGLGLTASSIVDSLGAEDEANVLPQTDDLIDRVPSPAGSIPLSETNATQELMATQTHDKLLCEDPNKTADPEQIENLLAISVDDMIKGTIAQFNIDKLRKLDQDICILTNTHDEADNSSGLSRAICARDLAMHLAERCRVAQDVTKCTNVDVCQIVTSATEIDNFAGEVTRNRIIGDLNGRSFKEVFCAMYDVSVHDYHLVFVSDDTFGKIVENDDAPAETAISGAEQVEGAVDIGTGPQELREVSIADPIDQHVNSGGALVSEITQGESPQDHVNSGGADHEHSEFVHGSTGLQKLGSVHVADSIEDHVSSGGVHGLEIVQTEPAKNQVNSGGAGHEHFESAHGFTGLQEPGGEHVDDLLGTQGSTARALTSQTNQEELVKNQKVSETDTGNGLGVSEVVTSNEDAMLTDFVARIIDIHENVKDMDQPMFLDAMCQVYEQSQEKRKEMSFQHQVTAAGKWLTTLLSESAHGFPEEKKKAATVILQLLKKIDTSDHVLLVQTVSQMIVMDGLSEKSRIGPDLFPSLANESKNINFVVRFGGKAPTGDMSDVFTTFLTNMFLNATGVHLDIRLKFVPYNFSCTDKDVSERTPIQRTSALMALFLHGCYMHVEYASGLSDSDVLTVHQFVTEHWDSCDAEISMFLKEQNCSSDDIELVNAWEHAHQNPHGIKEFGAKHSASAHTEQLTDMLGQVLTQMSMIATDSASSPSESSSDGQLTPNNKASPPVPMGPAGAGYLGTSSGSSNIEKNASPGPSKRADKKGIFDKNFADEVVAAADQQQNHLSRGDGTDYEGTGLSGKISLPQSGTSDRSIVLWTTLLEQFDRIEDRLQIPVDIDSTKLKLILCEYRLSTDFGKSQRWNEVFNTISALQAELGTKEMVLSHHVCNRRRLSRKKQLLVISMLRLVCEIEEDSSVQDKQTNKSEAVDTHCTDVIDHANVNDGLRIQDQLVVGCTLGSLGIEKLLQRVQGYLIWLELTPMVEALEQCVSLVAASALSLMNRLTSQYPATKNTVSGWISSATLYGVITNNECCSDCGCGGLMNLNRCLAMVEITRYCSFAGFPVRPEEPAEQKSTGLTRAFNEISAQSLASGSLLFSTVVFDPAMLNAFGEAIDLLGKELVLQKWHGIVNAFVVRTRVSAVGFLLESQFDSFMSLKSALGDDDGVLDTSPSSPFHLGFVKEKWQEVLLIAWSIITTNRFLGTNYKRKNVLEWMEDQIANSTEELQDLASSVLHVCQIMRNVENGRELQFVPHEQINEFVQESCFLHTRTAASDSVEPSNSSKTQMIVWVLEAYWTNFYALRLDSVASPAFVSGAGEIAMARTATVRSRIIELSKTVARSIVENGVFPQTEELSQPQVIKSIVRRKMEKLRIQGHAHLHDLIALVGALIDGQRGVVIGPNGFSSVDFIVQDTNVEHGTLTWVHAVLVQAIWLWQEHKARHLSGSSRGGKQFRAGMNLRSYLSSIENMFTASVTTTVIKDGDSYRVPINRVERGYWQRLPKWLLVGVAQQLSVELKGHKARNVQQIVQAVQRLREDTEDSYFSDETYQNVGSETAEDIAMHILDVSMAGGSVIVNILPQRCVEQEGLGVTYMQGANQTQNVPSASCQSSKSGMTVPPTRYEQSADTGAANNNRYSPLSSVSGTNSSQPSEGNCSSCIYCLMPRWGQVPEKEPKRLTRISQFLFRAWSEIGAVVPKGTQCCVCFQNSHILCAYYAGCTYHGRPFEEVLVANSLVIRNMLTTPRVPEYTCARCADLLPSMRELVGHLPFGGIPFVNWSHPLGVHYDDQGPHEIRDLLCQSTKLFDSVEQEIFFGTQSTEQALSSYFAGEMYPFCEVTSLVHETHTIFDETHDVLSISELNIYKTSPGDGGVTVKAVVHVEFPVAHLRIPEYWCTEEHLRVFISNFGLSTQFGIKNSRFMTVETCNCCGKEMRDGLSNMPRPSVRIGDRGWEVLACIPCVATHGRVVTAQKLDCVDPVHESVELKMDDLNEVTTNVDLNAVKRSAPLTWAKPGDQCWNSMTANMPIVIAVKESWAIGRGDQVRPQTGAILDLVKVATQRLADSLQEIVQQTDVIKDQLFRMTSEERDDSLVILQGVYESVRELITATFNGASTRLQRASDVEAMSTSFAVALRCAVSEHLALKYVPLLRVVLAHNCLSIVEFVYLFSLSPQSGNVEAAILQCTNILEHCPPSLLGSLNTIDNQKSWKLPNGTVIYHASVLRILMKVVLEEARNNAELNYERITVYLKGVGVDTAGIVSMSLHEGHSSMYREQRRHWRAYIDMLLQGNTQFATSIANVSVEEAQRMPSTNRLIKVVAPILADPPGVMVKHIERITRRLESWTPHQDWQLESLRLSYWLANVQKLLKLHTESVASQGKGSGRYMAASFPSGVKPGTITETIQTAFRSHKLPKYNLLKHDDTDLIWEGKVATWHLKFMTIFVELPYIFWIFVNVAELIEARDRGSLSGIAPNCFKHKEVDSELNMCTETETSKIKSYNKQLTVWHSVWTGYKAIQEAYGHILQDVNETSLTPSAKREQHADSKEDQIGKFEPAFDQVMILANIIGLFPEEGTTDMRKKATQELKQQFKKQHVKWDTTKDFPHFYEMFLDMIETTQWVASRWRVDHLQLTLITEIKSIVTSCINDYETSCSKSSLESDLRSQLSLMTNAMDSYDGNMKVKGTDIDVYENWKNGPIQLQHSVRIPREADGLPNPLYYLILLIKQTQSTESYLRHESARIKSTTRQRNAAVPSRAATPNSAGAGAGFPSVGYDSTATPRSRHKPQRTSKVRSLSATDQTEQDKWRTTLHKIELGQDGCSTDAPTPVFPKPIRKFYTVTGAPRACDALSEALGEQLGVKAPQSLVAAVTLSSIAPLSGSDLQLTNGVIGNYDGMGTQHCLLCGDNHSLVQMVPDEQGGLIPKKVCYAQQSNSAGIDSAKGVSREHDIKYFPSLGSPCQDQLRFKLFGPQVCTDLTKEGVLLPQMNRVNALTMHTHSANYKSDGASPNSCPFCNFFVKKQSAHQSRTCYHLLKYDQIRQVNASFDALPRCWNAQVDNNKFHFDRWSKSGLTSAERDFEISAWLKARKLLEPTSTRAIQPYSRPKGAGKGATGRGAGARSSAGRGFGGKGAGGKNSKGKGAKGKGSGNTANKGKNGKGGARSVRFAPSQETQYNPIDRRGGNARGRGASRNSSKGKGFNTKGKGKGTGVSPSSRASAVRAAMSSPTKRSVFGVRSSHSLKSVMSFDKDANRDDFNSVNTEDPAVKAFEDSSKGAALWRYHCRLAEHLRLAGVTHDINGQDVIVNEWLSLVKEEVTPADFADLKRSIQEAGTLSGSATLQHYKSAVVGRAVTSVGVPSGMPLPCHTPELLPLSSISKVTVKDEDGFFIRKDVSKAWWVLHVFGENDRDKDTNHQVDSTQAIIRGLPNAVGIRTCFARGKGYWDSHYDVNKLKIDADFCELETLYRSGTFSYILFPGDGLGTGVAKLDTEAPRTYAYVKWRRAQTLENLRSNPRDPSVVRNHDQNYVVGSRTHIAQSPATSNQQLDFAMESLSIVPEEPSAVGSFSSPDSVRTVPVSSRSFGLPANLNSVLEPSILQYTETDCCNPQCARKCVVCPQRGIPLNFCSKGCAKFCGDYVGPEVTNPSSTRSLPAPDCPQPHCERKCWLDLETGLYFPHCSRTCRDYCIDLQLQSCEQDNFSPILFEKLEQLRLCLCQWRKEVAPGLKLRSRVGIPDDIRIVVMDIKNWFIRTFAYERINKRLVEYFRYLKKMKEEALVANSEWRYVQHAHLAKLYYVIFNNTVLFDELIDEEEYIGQFEDLDVTHFCASPTCCGNNPTYMVVKQTVCNVLFDRVQHQEFFEFNSTSGFCSPQCKSRADNANDIGEDITDEPGEVGHMVGRERIVPRIVQNHNQTFINGSRVHVSQSSATSNEQIDAVSCEGIVTTPPLEQLAIDKGQIFASSKIVEYCICTQIEWELWVSNCVVVSDIITVVVQALDGAELQLKVERGSTIATIKRTVEECNGFSIYCQVFYLIHGEDDTVESASSLSLSLFRETSDELLDSSCVCSSCSICLTIDVARAGTWAKNSSLITGLILAFRYDPLVRDPPSELYPVQPTIKLSGDNDEIATRIHGDYGIHNANVTARVLHNGVHTISIKILEQGNCCEGIYLGLLRETIARIDQRILEYKDGWFICTSRGILQGNCPSNKRYDGPIGQRFQNIRNKADDCEVVGDIEIDDILTMQVNLDTGSLKFWVNGEPHGPGHTGVEGPVRWATGLEMIEDSVEIVSTPPLRSVWFTPFTHKTAAYTVYRFLRSYLAMQRAAIFLQRCFRKLFYGPVSSHFQYSVLRLLSTHTFTYNECDFQRASLRYFINRCNKVCDDNPVEIHRHRLRLHQESITRSLLPSRSWVDDHGKLCAESYSYYYHYEDEFGAHHPNDVTIVPKITRNNDDHTSSTSPFAMTDNRQTGHKQIDSVFDRYDGDYHARLLYQHQHGAQFDDEDYHAYLSMRAYMIQTWARLRLLGKYKKGELIMIKLRTSAGYDNWSEYKILQISPVGDIQFCSLGCPRRIKWISRPDLASRAKHVSFCYEDYSQPNVKVTFLDSDKEPFTMKVGHSVYSTLDEQVQDIYDHLAKENGLVMSNTFIIRLRNSGSGENLSCLGGNRLEQEVSHTYKRKSKHDTIPGFDLDWLEDHFWPTNAFEDGQEVLIMQLQPFDTELYQRLWTWYISVPVPGATMNRASYTQLPTTLETGEWLFHSPMFPAGAAQSLRMTALQMVSVIEAARMTMQGTLCVSRLGTFPYTMSDADIKLSMMRKDGARELNSRHVKDVGSCSVEKLRGLYSYQRQNLFDPSVSDMGIESGTSVCRRLGYKPKQKNQVLPEEFVLQICPNTLKHITQCKCHYSMSGNRQESGMNLRCQVELFLNLRNIDRRDEWADRRQTKTLPPPGSGTCVPDETARVTFELRAFDVWADVGDEAGQVPLSHRFDWDVYSGASMLQGDELVAVLVRYLLGEELPDLPDAISSRYKRPFRTQVMKEVLTERTSTFGERQDVSFAVLTAATENVWRLITEDCVHTAPVDISVVVSQLKGVISCPLCKEDVTLTLSSPVRAEHLCSLCYWDAPGERSRQQCAVGPRFHCLNCGSTVCLSCSLDLRSHDMEELSTARELATYGLFPWNVECRVHIVPESAMNCDKCKVNNLGRSYLLNRSEAVCETCGYAVTSSIVDGKCQMCMSDPTAKTEQLKCTAVVENPVYSINSTRQVPSTYGIYFWVSVTTELIFLQNDETRARNHANCDTEEAYYQRFSGGVILTQRCEYDALLEHLRGSGVQFGTSRTLSLAVNNLRSRGVCISYEDCEVEGIGTIERALYPYALQGSSFQDTGIETAKLDKLLVQYSEYPGDEPMNPRSSMSSIVKTVHVCLEMATRVVVITSLSADLLITHDIDLRFDTLTRFLLEGENFPAAENTIKLVHPRTHGVNDISLRSHEMNQQHAAMIHSLHERHIEFCHSSVGFQNRSHIYVKVRDIDRASGVGPFEVDISTDFDTQHIFGAGENSHGSQLRATDAQALARLQLCRLAGYITHKTGLDPRHLRFYREIVMGTTSTREKIIRIEPTSTLLASFSDVAKVVPGQLYVFNYVNEDKIDSGYCHWDSSAEALRSRGSVATNAQLMAARCASLALFHRSWKDEHGVFQAADHLFYRTEHTSKLLGSYVMECPPDCISCAANVLAHTRYEENGRLPDYLELRTLRQRYKGHRQLPSRIQRNHDSHTSIDSPFAMSDNRKTGHKQIDFDQPDDSDTADQLLLMQQGSFKDTAIFPFFRWVPDCGLGRTNSMTQTVIKVEENAVSFSRPTSQFVPESLTCPCGQSLEWRILNEENECVTCSLPFSATTGVVPVGFENALLFCSSAIQSDAPFGTEGCLFRTCSMCARGMMEREITTYAKSTIPVTVILDETREEEPDTTSLWLSIASGVQPLLDSVFSDETLSHLEDLAVDRFHGWRASCEYSNALAKVDAVISELVVTCICGECSRPYQFIREFLLFLTLDETLSSYPRTRFVWLVALWRQEIIANKTQFQIRQRASELVGELNSMTPKILVVNNTGSDKLIQSAWFESDEPRAICRDPIPGNVSVSDPMVPLPLPSLVPNNDPHTSITSPRAMSDNRKTGHKQIFEAGVVLVHPLMNDILRSGYGTENWASARLRESVILAIQLPRQLRLRQLALGDTDFDDANALASTLQSSLLQSPHHVCLDIVKSLDGVFFHVMSHVHHESTELEGIMIAVPPVGEDTHLQPYDSVQPIAGGVVIEAKRGLCQHRKLDSFHTMACDCLYSLSDDEDNVREVPVATCELCGGSGKVLVVMVEQRSTSSVSVIRARNVVEVTPMVGLSRQDIWDAVMEDHHGELLRNSCSPPIRAAAMAIAVISLTSVVHSGFVGCNAVLRNFALFSLSQMDKSTEHSKLWFMLEELYHAYGDSRNYDRLRSMLKVYFSAAGSSHIHEGVFWCESDCKCDLSYGPHKPVDFRTDGQDKKMIDVLAAVGIPIEYLSSEYVDRYRMMEDHQTWIQPPVNQEEINPGTGDMFRAEDVPQHTNCMRRMSHRYHQQVYIELEENSKWNGIQSDHEYIRYHHGKPDGSSFIGTGARRLSVMLSLFWRDSLSNSYAGISAFTRVFNTREDLHGCDRVDVIQTAKSDEPDAFTVTTFDAAQPVDIRGEPHRHWSCEHTYNVCGKIYDLSFYGNFSLHFNTLQVKCSAMKDLIPLLQRVTCAVSSLTQPLILARGYSSTLKILLGINPHLHLPTEAQGYANQCGAPVDKRLHASYLHSLEWNGQNDPDLMQVRHDLMNKKDCDKGTDFYHDGIAVRDNAHSLLQTFLLDLHSSNHVGPDYNAAVTALVDFLPIRSALSTLLTEIPEAELRQGSEAGFHRSFHPWFLRQGSGAGFHSSFDMWDLVASVLIMIQLARDACTSIRISLDRMTEQQQNVVGNQSVVACAQAVQELRMFVMQLSNSALSSCLPASAVLTSDIAARSMCGILNQTHDSCDESHSIKVFEARCLFARQLQHQGSLLFEIRKLRQYLIILIDVSLKVETCRNNWTHANINDLKDFRWEITSSVLVQYLSAQRRLHYCLGLLSTEIRAARAVASFQDRESSASSQPGSSGIFPSNTYVSELFTASWATETNEWDLVIKALITEKLVTVMPNLVCQNYVPGTTAAAMFVEGDNLDPFDNPCSTTNARRVCECGEADMQAFAAYRNKIVRAIARVEVAGVNRIPLYLQWTPRTNVEDPLPDHFGWYFLGIPEEQFTLSDDVTDIYEACDPHPVFTSSFMMQDHSRQHLQTEFMLLLRRSDGTFVRGCNTPLHDAYDPSEDSDEEENEDADDGAGGCANPTPSSGSGSVRSSTTTSSQAAFGGSPSTSTRTCSTLTNQATEWTPLIHSLRAFHQEISLKQKDVLSNTTNMIRDEFMWYLKYTMGLKRVQHDQQEAAARFDQSPGLPKPSATYRFPPVDLTYSGKHLPTSLNVVLVTDLPGINSLGNLTVVATGPLSNTQDRQDSPVWIGVQDSFGGAAVSDSLCDLLTQGEFTDVPRIVAVPLCEAIRFALRSPYLNEFPHLTHLPMVHPNLFLGSTKNAKHQREMIQSHRITWIVTTEEKSLPAGYAMENVQYIHYPLFDDMDHCNSLTSTKCDIHGTKSAVKLTAVLQQVGTLLTSNQGVLVHCTAGINRAPAFCIMYALMFCCLNKDSRSREDLKRWITYVQHARAMDIATDTASFRPDKILFNLSLQQQLEAHCPAPNESGRVSRSTIDNIWSGEVPSGFEWREHYHR